MSLLEIILYIIAGVFAGFINTIAGSGSIITLSALSLMGLPSPIANATNRVGVLAQTLVGGSTLYHGLKDEIPTTIWWQLVPGAIGGILGALTAVSIPEYWLDRVIGVLLVFVLLLVITNNDSWTKADAKPKQNHKSMASIFIYLFIGFYGGFVQVAVGIFIMAVAVLFSGYNIKYANLIKALLVAVFTIPSVMVFQLQHMIVWKAGLILAVGQMSGAYFAAKFMIQFPDAHKWVRRLLVVMIIIGIFQFFHLTKWLI